MASVSHERALSTSTQSTLWQASARSSAWKGLQPSPQHTWQARQPWRGQGVPKPWRTWQYSGAASLLFHSHPRLPGSSEADPALETRQRGLLSRTPPGRDGIQLQAQRSAHPSLEKQGRPWQGNAMSYRWTTQDTSPSASSPRDGKHILWHSVTNVLTQ